MVDVERMRSRYNRADMKPLTTELEATITRYLQQSLEALPLIGIDVSYIITNLANEILDSSRQDAEENTYAPDQFTLTTSPQSSGDLRRGLGLLQSQISLQLEEALATAGYQLTHPVHITFASDPTLKDGEVRIIAWHSRDPLQLHAQMMDYVEPETSTPPRGAFMIVNGKRHFPLTKRRVSIGRRLDNDLVLDDPHVSREHAELIAVKGFYLLRDLNSKAGTRVNKKLIKEHRLEPGDVLQFASIEIIYGEDPLGPPTETPPYQPSSTPRSPRDDETPLGLKSLRDMDTSVFHDVQFPKD